MEPVHARTEVWWNPGGAQMRWSKDTVEAGYGGAQMRSGSGAMKPGAKVRYRSGGTQALWTLGAVELGYSRAWIRWSKDTRSLGAIDFLERALALPGASQRNQRK